MRVFVSWSGEKSKKVAELLHAWIPKVIQSIKPWVSTEDIETGSIWFNQICKEIKEVCNSIIVVTKENKEKPWIMFEAGALCKGDDTNRLNVLLVDVSAKDIKQPLASFNMLQTDKEGLRKLMYNLNIRATQTSADADYNIANQDLDEIFDMWYPKFKEGFDSIMKDYPDTEITKPKNKMEAMQEEILMSIRSIERVLIGTEKQTANTKIPYYGIDDFSTINMDNIEKKIVKDYILYRSMNKKKEWYSIEDDKKDSKDENCC